MCRNSSMGCAACSAQPRSGCCLPSMSWLKDLGTIRTIGSNHKLLILRELIVPVLNEIKLTLRTTRDRSASLREVQRNVEALTTALTRHGESFAQTLRALQESSTDFQALALIVRETCGAVTGLTTGFMGASNSRASRDPDRTPESNQGWPEDPEKAQAFLPSNLFGGSSRSPGKRTDAGNSQSIP
jgi:hypothetical protein